MLLIVSRASYIYAIESSLLRPKKTMVNETDHNPIMVVIRVTVIDIGDGIVLVREHCGPRYGPAFVMQ